MFDIVYVPRTRGDEPIPNECRSALENLFPAHAGMNRTVYAVDQGRLFPAHAGMNRRLKVFGATACLFPAHAGMNLARAARYP